MAKQKTEKSKLPSFKGGGMVTEGQYLTELLCINIASKDGKDLPDKFWQLGEWAGRFRQQIQAVSALLAVYDYQAIAKALRDKRAKNAYSFRAPWLKDVIEEKQREFNIAKEAAAKQAPLKDKLDTVSQPVKPMPRPGDKSLIKRLKNL